MSGETATIMQVWASVGSVIAALLVGAAQCALIWVGLRQMRTSSEERNRQLDNQETAAADRHAESMRALEALIKGMETVIERTGGTRGTA